MKIYQNSPEVKTKKSEFMKIYHNKMEVKSKKSEMFLKLWKDPEFAKMMGQALNIFPNKPETIILNILNELYPNEWKYTGDFSFIINGKSPDFTNVNGQKKLVEFFGLWWHGEKHRQKIDTIPLK